MELIQLLAALLVGFVIGFGAAFILKVLNTQTARELAGTILEENDIRRQENTNTVITTVKAQFGEIWPEMLTQTTDMAKQKLEAEREVNTRELDGKKALIDKQLANITAELDKVSQLVNNLEKDRENKFGELTKQLEMTGKQTAELIQSTGTLREALASTKIRGQWGERMAKDILDIAGFIEGVNYVKQTAIEGKSNIPDFTFFLPRELRLNMDVKFPFNNYVRFLEANAETEKESYRKSFLRDVKNRIKEITTRDYIDPEQNTVDYVLLFIPNEQIYAFIFQEDSSIVDESLKKKVVICSPITLFAVLAIIRQAVDNFTFEQTSKEIIGLLGSFKKQWEKFIDVLTNLGKRIELTQKAYYDLITTRRSELEKPLNKIEEIRIGQGITPREIEAGDDDGGAL